MCICIYTCVYNIYTYVYISYFFSIVSGSGQNCKLTGLTVAGVLTDPVTLWLLNRL